MLFNSYEFIFIFLPISFFVYFYLNKIRLTLAAKFWLAGVSLFFYSWWNVLYLPLIVVSILFNFSVSSSMLQSQEKKKKLLLRFGVLFNVILLMYFKYMDFFIENINGLTQSNFELLNLALPLAISFFTLQQIAFLVDSYEGLVKEKRLLDYVIFVAFFPQLIAGPIVHHKEMMPQFFSVRNKVKNYRNIALGLFIFSIGLFKKVIIADSFAVWATAGFDNATVLTFIEAWVASLSYTVQLYFDFSGYTDMAIGAALLFNIKLPQNFNSPYKACGMIDFWKRWHISLTNFITTYIYTPIIKSFTKLTFHKAMMATVITFLIAGFWHGASWMFVIFGTLNGIGIVLNHYWRKSKRKINIYLSWFITFNYINITFVFFRAEAWSDAIKVLKGMVALNGIVLPQTLETKVGVLKEYHVEFGGITANIGASITEIVIAFILAGILISCKNAQDLVRINRNPFYYSILFFVSVYSLNKATYFIYFNF